MTWKCLSMTVLMAVMQFFGPGSTPAADEIKVGILAPVTGPDAAFGRDIENAVLLAVSEINAKGGILGYTVVTATGDDECSPRQAVSAAGKLVSENVAGVVGGYCSPATVPTLKVFGDAGIPLVITAANSSGLISANPGNAFQIVSTGYDQAITAVHFFKEKKIRRLAIVHEKDGYSTELAILTEKKWRKMGYEVVDVEMAVKGEADYSALVNRLKKKSPDGVFWTAYFDDAPRFIQQLRQSGYAKLIALGDGSNSPRLIETAGKAADGIFCFSKPMIEYLPAAKEFIESYRKKFNKEPGPYSALAYDGMNLLADAIVRAGTADKAGIIKALKETRDFAGIAGPISFRKDNTLARSNFVVLVAGENAWTLYK